MSARLYLGLHMRDFPVQAEVRVCPELRGHAVAVLDGVSSLETVFSLNDRARGLGLERGMSRVQAESFISNRNRIALRSRVKAREDSAFRVLMECAERFSPRVEVLASPAESVSGATLVLDIAACERLFGTPKQIAEALLRATEAAGFEASAATSVNAYAAVVAARGFAGITVIPTGNEASVLAPLPLAVLELEAEQRETFASWGIRTLGQLAGLPQTALVARVGEVGHRLQALSRGECEHLLTPVEPPADAVLSESTELEHPVDLLEPLLFLISRMLEQIFRRAAARALAIAQVETRLVLDGVVRREHRRMVRPALPEWSYQTLLKLVQLDLELHPPEAAVIGLHLVAQPARSQTVQQGLFTPQTPEAGRLEILLARLRKLVGENRVGAAELLDSHRPEAFRMASFVPSASTASRAFSGPCPSALRILRPPRVIRVEVKPTAEKVVSKQGPCPQRLKPNSQQCAYRSAEALRHPKASSTLSFSASSETGPCPKTCANQSFSAGCEDGPCQKTISQNSTALHLGAFFLEGQKFMVQRDSGPWKASGAWWTYPEWSREEWDLALGGQDRKCCRVAYDPASDCWYLIGIYD
ncbi:MAG: DNA polymerase Y family protein [Terriglobales bacterium]